MTDIEFEYLQRDHEGYKAGTPLVKAEPSTAHRQARALTKSNIPVGYYSPVGSDEVLMIPRFNGLVDKLHPQAIERIGPFMLGEVRVDRDRLAKWMAMAVSIEKAYPVINVRVCLNSEMDLSRWSGDQDDVAFQNVDSIVLAQEGLDLKHVLEQVVGRTLNHLDRNEVPFTFPI